MPDVVHLYWENRDQITQFCYLCYTSDHKAQMLHMNKKIMSSIHYYNSADSIDHNEKFPVSELIFVFPTKKASH